MNYFLQINAFYESLETKPLKPPAIALWHALMNIANKSGWPEALTVSIKALSMKTGMNEKAVERARNTLAQTGYVHWKSRGGSASAVYIIFNLYDKNTHKNVAQPVAQSVVEPVAQSVAQPVGIIKQELELEPQPNITTDRSVCLSCDEEVELAEILDYIQPHALEPHFWREEIADYVQAMYRAPGIWVSKTRIPQSEVRQRMRQLDHDTVQWAIDQIKNADEIDNPRSYMMAVLYNAPIDFSAFTSIDVARKLW